MKVTVNTNGECMLCHTQRNTRTEFCKLCYRRVCDRCRDVVKDPDTYVCKLCLLSGEIEDQFASTGTTQYEHTRNIDLEHLEIDALRIWEK